MKNFFKKLSFVLAIAMVLTTVVPATASAAGKNYMELNGKKVTSVTAWIGGVTRNLDYNVGGKTSGVKGTWKVGNTSVATINAYGVVTPVANGTTKVRFTPADNSGAVTITLKVRTRAAALHVYDPVEYEAGTKNQLEGTTVELNAGDTKNLKVTMPISKKAVAAGGVGATYFLYAQVSDETVVSATVGTNNRSVTLKGLAAGEATVTLLANQTTEANVKSNKYYKEASFTVKVAENDSISVEATHAKELVATLGVAPATDAKVAVTRGTTNVDATYKIDGNKVVITTAAKMIAGTYTVKVGDLEGSVAVEDQLVKEIVVDNENSYVGTDANSKVAYVYFDVLDQYGDSMLKTATVKWNSSLKEVAAQTSMTDGKLALSTDGTAAGDTLTYGSTIYLVGTYNEKTNVVTKTAEVKVGLPSKVDEVSVAGVVKAGTTEFGKLPQVLGTTIGTSDYYLAFTAKDQYGEDVDVTDTATAGSWVNTISVTGTTPLVLQSAFDKTNAATYGTVTIGDVDYALIKVVAGTYYSKGGTASFQFVSGGTGKTTVYSIDVNADQILTTFTLGTPGDIVSEGRKVELPFTAVDQNGNEITSYRVLNGNVKLTTTSGVLTIEENDDGTAALYYTAPATGASEDVDLYVSITSVVTDSANVDTKSFYVKEQATPVAIAGLSNGGAKYVLEGDSTTIVKDKASSLYGLLNYAIYADQYGRTMDSKNRYERIDINAFFNAGGLLKVNAINNTYVNVSDNGANTITITAKPIDGVTTNQSHTYELYLVGTDGNDIGGSSKKFTTTTIDISKLVSFSDVAVGSLYKNDNSALSNGSYPFGGSVTLLGFTSDGAAVNVPYWYDEANTIPYFSISSNTVSGYSWDTAVVTTTGAAVYEFYDADATFKDSSNNYRNEKVQLVVTVNDVNANGVKDVVKNVVEISNKTNVATTLGAGVLVADGKATMWADNGALTHADIADSLSLYVSTDWWTLVKDQYGKTMTADPANLVLTFTKIVENADGINEGSIAVSANGTTSAGITGLEIGDKFTVTYSYGGVDLLTVDVTMGADAEAFVSSATNSAASVLY